MREFCLFICNVNQLCRNVNSYVSRPQKMNQEYLPLIVRPLLTINLPLPRYRAVPLLPAGSIFSSAPPGKRANSDAPFTPPLTIVVVMTGDVIFVDTPLTNSLCNCAPLVPLGRMAVFVVDSCCWVVT